MLTLQTAIVTQGNADVGDNVAHQHQHEVMARMPMTVGNPADNGLITEQADASRMLKMVSMRKEPEEDAGAPTLRTAMLTIGSKAWRGRITAFAKR